MTNIVLILADDLGFSDLGCYGGEIDTPNLDRLGRRGVRMSSFYNTARCSPSRASLLTGRHPHETGVGILTDDQRPWGYPGSLDPAVPTVAELFREAGYATCLSGKWHLSADTAVPNETWPTRRGFDEFYGILGGADDYFHPRGLFAGEQRQPPPGDGFYLTDAIGRHAAEFVARQAQAARPFLLYLAFTAPHWPLHAPEEDVRHYEGRFDEGWDVLRERRLARAVEEGILGDKAALSVRDPNEPPWSGAAHREWEARRMSVYAAQVTAMDRAIGHVLSTVECSGVAEDTLVVFLADNGACAEEMPPADAPKFRERQPQHTLDGKPMRIGNEPGIRPGADDTFASYGRAWANLSNTPFRFYKRWVHEGGIASPFLVHWPAGGLAAGSTVHTPHQLPDVLPTLLDAAGLIPPDGPGVSMLPQLRGEPEDGEHTLFWEHIGNAAARRGRWKIVREAGSPWELYDLATDRAERHDLAAARPELVDELADSWQRWADSVGVIPRDTILRKARPGAAP
ncbi:arylsulfatase [Amycolatopsis taiwanensis]|uniref:Sulfatase n=1 Tax=Amycolatopsis taiwanensis TaxID=342230 RepID=A0A9W6RCI8_9PSEU|nr:arylsulfatase [Amycolatopsis taiwanensis]GLY71582.1 sulfatase [Amycolatopsis taiwanensis]